MTRPSPSGPVIIPLITSTLRVQASTLLHYSISKGNAVHTHTRATSRSSTYSQSTRHIPLSSSSVVISKKTMQSQHDNCRNLRSNVNVISHHKFVRHRACSPSVIIINPLPSISSANHELSLPLPFIEHRPSPSFHPMPNSLLQPTLVAQTPISRQSCVDSSKSNGSQSTPTPAVVVTASCLSCAAQPLLRSRL